MRRASILVPAFVLGGWLLRRHGGELWRRLFCIIVRKRFIGLAHSLVGAFGGGDPGRLRRLAKGVALPVGAANIEGGCGGAFALNPFNNDLKTQLAAFS